MYYGMFVYAQNPYMHGLTIGYDLVVVLSPVLSLSTR